MLEMLNRRQRIAAAFHAAMVTACCGMVPMPAHSAQTHALVEVKVVLRQGAGDGRTPPTLCRNTSVASAFGASATVVCSTGALVDMAPGRDVGLGKSMHGGAYRYVTQASWNGDWLESLDDSTGMGTITSWRIVNLVGRNYLEMTVGW